VLLSSGVTVVVRVRFGVWLVSGYSHVFILLSIVIVTLPVLVLWFVQLEFNSLWFEYV